jgi:hypothetical protein
VNEHIHCAELADCLFNTARRGLGFSEISPNEHASATERFDASAICVRFVIDAARYQRKICASLCQRNGSSGTNAFGPASYQTDFTFKPHVWNAAQGEHAG